ncbi:MAG: FG-GAP-like repeat-containing protein [Candidatus Zixiibacteriota bacterium]
MRTFVVTLIFAAAVVSTLSAKTLTIRGKQPSEAQKRNCLQEETSDRNLLGLERESKFSLPKQALSPNEPRVIRILAIKAQFKKETPDNPLTTGDGNYDLRTMAEFEGDEGHSIDPAPHNNDYFRAQLQALNAYYETVSNGRVTLVYDTYPTQSTAVYQLDSAMAYYGLQEPEFGLTEFYFDAFAKADEDPELQFVNPTTGEPNYDAFIVFHPGSDQQNNLPGFGIETPGDLFTGYLRLGAPISVQNDSLLIFDGMVMPETVSQDGRVTALNAVMAHEFGHQLGLVDLYDTRTFNTAVGDFSLMDNNGFGVNIDFGTDVSIVLVQGVMPIFPDAWSRAYLGFVDVVEVSAGSNIRVAAAELSTTESQVIMAPINADEYFLIENRRTDIDGDGLTNLKADDATGVIQFPTNTQAVANNREYDYLTPGSGMLIWHVDELAARLDFDGDGFNNFDDNDLQWFNFASDPRRWDNRHQFVTLMEADGRIEFGREYFAGYGTQADLFEINGNDILGPTTNPSSAANTGAYSGITIDNISAAVPTMSCRIRTDGRGANWPNYVGKGASALRVYDLNADGSDEIITTVDNYVLAYNYDGTSFFQPIAGTEVVVERPTLVGDKIAPDTLAVLGRVASDREFSMALAVGDLDGDGFAEIVGATNRFTIAAFSSRSLSNIGEAIKRFETFVDEPIAIAPIILEYDESVAGKEILLYTMTNRKIVLDRDGDVILNEPSTWPYRVFTDSLHRFELISPAGGMRGSADATAIRGAAAGDFDRNGSFETCEVYVGGTLKINYASNPLIVNVGGPVFSEVALGDINNDGDVEIVFCGDNLIYGYNANGTPVEDFPIKVNPAHPVGPLRCSPTLADINGDGVMEIFVGAGTGELSGFDLTGSRLENFPRAAGGNVDSPVAVARNAGQGAVLALSREGEINSFNISRPQDRDWNALYGSMANTGSYVRGVPALTVAGEAIGYVYNYPNPAADHTTIRFSVRQSGTVSLKFYNTAGDLVLESNVAGVAGTDNEHLVDTSHLAAGVYFCQLETGSGDRKHCSIAILK